MKKINILLLSVALILPVISTAENQKEIYLQPTTVVTASRYGQNKDDVIPSITVIDREEILNLQANNVLDLLSIQKGIDVARTGGNGGTTSIFIRGTNSNHSLVLINGTRVGSSFTGSFAWEHLPVSQIERIEIVRGTRVSFYGADAIGGVINIITRKQNNLYFRYTGGSYDTHNFDISYGKVFDHSQYSLSLGSQKTTGFSATNENNEWAYNPDNDGYENHNINFNYSKKLNDNELEFNYFETHGDVDFDTGNSDSIERVTQLGWSSNILGNWLSKLTVSNNYNSLKTKVFSSNFNSQRYSLDWIINGEINNNNFVYGLTYRVENAEFINPNATEVSFSDSRNNTAGFVNWQRRYKNNLVSTSLRFDNNSVYSNDISSNLDYSYLFSDTIKLNFAVGTAFHAPNINELFSPNFQGIVVSPITGESSFAFAFEGNPDLKPEESINYELALKYKLSEKHSFSINSYYYKIDNLISYQGETFKPINIFEATIKGFEIDYTFSLDSLNFSINTTIQDANNDETDTPLLRRPDNKLNINIDKYFGKISLGSSFRYASQSYDFGAVLDSYTVLDLRTSYKLNQNWRVALKLENILNNDYQIINGFNTPKSSGYLTIEWQQ